MKTIRLISRAATILLFFSLNHCGFLLLFYLKTPFQPATVHSRNSGYLFYHCLPASALFPRKTELGVKQTSHFRILSCIVSISPNTPVVSLPSKVHLSKSAAFSSLSFSYFFLNHFLIANSHHHSFTTFFGICHILLFLT